MKDLPIYPFLEDICSMLLSSPSRFLVLTAETAAGKSTAIPPALLHRVPGKIVMLEPRRIATVAIASRIAELLGEETGQTAGYRLHLDSKVSDATRIEIITEAILTRRIQGDPSLEGVSVVILDEFHERSVHADLALALLREITSLREDLFVLVMSATIDTARIAAYLDAPVFTVPGRQWPVEIVYDPFIPAKVWNALEEKTARAVRNELARAGGDLLVFLPGIAEIRRTQKLLEDAGAEILVLHSSVPFDEQKRVLNPPGGGRRVILSSSIAETSITVPGVSVVIDPGLSRIGRLDILTGMNRLVTETESGFSATQRAGRAGRTGPGRCVRLWAEHDVRLSETAPEITRTDIMPLVLECALWGVSNADGLPWLDPPNAGAWARAKELLVLMGALEGDARITGFGRAMCGLGLHPRLASIALSGGIDLAVKYADYSSNPREEARFKTDLERRLKLAGKAVTPKVRVGTAILLLAGFPDRIARHKADGIYQFPSGRLASLPGAVRSGTARHAKWIVAPEADAGEREGRIWSYEPLEEKDAEIWLSAHSVRTEEVVFSAGKDGTSGTVKKTEYETYGKLVLAERPLAVNAEDTARAYCAGIRKAGFSALPWTPASESFLQRARFANRVRHGSGEAADAENPAGETALLGSLEDWLLPFLPARGPLSGEALLEALRYRLDGRTVDRDVPCRLDLPSGQSRAIQYEELVPGDGPHPVLETRIKDLYGCADTPRVLGIPVLLRLLSPAGRPVQITSDLSGFWKTSWHEVRKEMKGRYPKHHWPENPLETPSDSTTSR